MNRVLIATDLPFWRTDRGDHARIAALARAIHDAGHPLAVFAATTLDEHDRAAIMALLPGIHLATLSTADADAAGALTPLEGPLTGAPLPVHQAPSDTHTPVRPHASMPPPQEKPATSQPLDFSSRDSLRQRLGHAARALMPAPALDLLRTLRNPPPFAGEPTLTDFESPMITAAFNQACAFFKPEAVIIEYIRLAYLARQCNANPRPHFLLDTLDVMHRRAAQFHAHGQPHWLAITPGQEAAACAPFDTLIAIQHADAHALRTLCPDTPVITAGHAPPMPPAPPLPPAPPISVLYIATGALPNRAAIQWFVRAVWKYTYRRHPDARLRVAGSIANAIPPSAEPFGIDAIGPATGNLHTLYQHAHIVINPVRFGGGLKIKTVEALAAGRPLLTTPSGIEGMPGDIRHAAVVVSGARAWRSALERLICEPDCRESLAAKAESYAQLSLIPSAAYGELLIKLRFASQK